jgi:hypothetical protein
VTCTLGKEPGVNAAAAMTAGDVAGHLLCGDCRYQAAPAGYFRRGMRGSGGRSCLGSQQKTSSYRDFTGATGLEPATSGVTGRRSNQLNYAPARDAGGLYLRLAALNDLAGGIPRWVVFRQGIA